MDQELQDVYRQAGLDPEDPDALLKRAQARARVGDDPGAYALLFQGKLAEARHPLACEIGGRIYEAEKELYPLLPGSFSANVEHVHADIGGLGDDYDEGPEEETDLEALERLRLPVTRLSCGSRIHGRATPALTGLSCLFSLRVSPGATAKDRRARRFIYETRPGDPAPLSRLKSLRRFTWTHRQISQDALRALEPLDQLRFLNLSGAKVSNRDTPIIARLRALEQLNLSHSPIDDEGLEPLAALTQLRGLSFHRAKILGPGLTVLALMPRLRSLGLWSCPLERGALKPVGAAPELRRLILNHSPIDDATVKDLGASRSIEALHLSRTEVGDEGIAALGAVTSLEQLYAGDSRIRGPGLRALEELPRLRTLSLDGCRLEDEAFAALAALPHLEFLSLRKARYKLEALETLVEAPALKTLMTDGASEAHFALLRRLRAARPDWRI